MYLPGVDLFDRRDTDDNNGDDGVSKCRFTITVFLPPCNVSPVYLLPPNSPTLPYSLVSLNSHLFLRILFSFFKNTSCLFHIYRVLFLLFLPIFSTKMKKNGQPIIDSVPWNSCCTKDPRWLNNVFLFSIEVWAEHLEKTPCIWNLQIAISFRA